MALNLAFKIRFNLVWLALGRGGGGEDGQFTSFLVLGEQNTKNEVNSLSSQK
jgi:hypothetical protein